MEVDIGPAASDLNKTFKIGTRVNPQAKSLLQVIGTEFAIKLSKESGERRQIGLLGRVTFMRVTKLVGYELIVQEKPGLGEKFTPDNTSIGLLPWGGYVVKLDKTFGGGHVKVAMEET